MRGEEAEFYFHLSVWLLVAVLVFVLLVSCAAVNRGEDDYVRPKIYAIDIEKKALIRRNSGTGDNVLFLNNGLANDYLCLSVDDMASILRQLKNIPE